MRPPARGPLRIYRYLLLAAVCAGAIALLGVLWPGDRSPRVFQDLSTDDQATFGSEWTSARSEMAEQDWEAAGRHLQRCISIYDRDPEVWTALAESSLGMRRGIRPGEISLDEEDALVDRAIEALDRAIEIDPRHAQAHKQRWVIHQYPSYRRFDPDRSLDSAEKALESAPEDLDFRRVVAEWVLSGVRFQRDRMGKLAFDSAIGLEVGEKHVAWILDRSPPGSSQHAQALYGMGQIYLYMGDFERALEYLKKLDGFRLGPETDAWRLREVGIAYYRLGEYAEAAASFLRSHDAKPSLEARWLLYCAYEELGKSIKDLPEEYRFPIPREDLDPANPPKIRFTEVGEEIGVAKVDGAGPSGFADYDNDGDPDIFVSGCDTFSALYRNDGGLFTNVTIEADLHDLAPGFSANQVDYDNDGHLDLYVARHGWNGNARNVLLHNRGDGTFENRSRESGLDDPGCGFVSIWFDADRDGMLDVFVTNGVLMDGCTNRLYRNRGDGTFEDVTEKTGLAEPRSQTSIGAAVGDYDKDGDPDIFVNGKADTPSRLYRNRGDGTFENVTDTAGIDHKPYSGYVAFFVDYDNDAWLDILATSLARWPSVLKGLARLVAPESPEMVQRNTSRLYRNNRDGSFSEVTFESGLGFPHGTMGANVADLDNDGYIDIYLGTGAPDMKRMEPTILYRSNGDGTFSDITRFAGLGHVGKGHGFTFADFDADGDLDIYAPQGGFCHGDLWANPFYRNEAGSENHWFHVKLRGVRSNRFAVGAQVTIRYGDHVQYREVEGGIGFGSTNSYPVEFGLGDTERIDEVEILWPSGHKQILHAPPVDAMIEVVEFQDRWRVVHLGAE